MITSSVWEIICRLLNYVNATDTDSLNQTSLNNLSEIHRLSVQKAKKIIHAVLF